MVDKLINMKKTIHITEKELNRIIERILSEQLAVGQNFQQGQQSGTASGQAARQAVNKAVNTGVQAGANAAASLLKGGKQILIKVGKTVFNVVIYGGVFIFLIGKGIYKVSQVVGNAIIKFLSSTGKVVISGATAVGNSLLNGLKAAGIALEKGDKWVQQQFNGLKDSSAAVIKWMLNGLKQFGVMAWGSFLIAAAKVSEWSGMLSGWIKQQYDTIASQIGVEWNNALKGVKNLGNKVMSGATDIANSASKYAGNAIGAIKGFLQEFFERFNNFKGTDSLTILSEAIKYNAQVI